MTTSEAIAPYTTEDLLTWEKLTASFPQPFATVLTINILTGANQSKPAGVVLRRALESLPDLQTKAHLVHKVREGLLKLVPLCGLPRVINSMNECVAVVDRDVLDALPTTPHRVATDFKQVEAWRERGNNYFERVYSGQSNELVNVLNNAYPDLTEIILQDTYGKILSDTRFITPMETELSAVGVLYAMQAYGHMAGHMKGSQNMGATEEQADKVVALAKAITAPLDGKWE